MPALKAAHAPGTASLLSAGCGTAVASVCAIGLFQIERTLGGIWSALSVLLAAVSCGVLARALGRLAGVVPSGAGILAYLARGCGRRLGVLIALPYVLLSLFLVGVEAVIIGVLVARYSPLPAALGALAFLLGTWALCSAGVRAGYRTQALATWALIGTLALTCAGALLSAAHSGELALRLFPAAPAPAQLIAGVGQALFLFMGFELVTSHAEVASHPAAVRRALTLSVLVLGAFYTLVSLGFSCAAVDTSDVAYRFAPQLAIAERSFGPAGVWLVVALTVLASFTSWNGGLLALSRFTAALASQGMLPRGLAQLDARTLVPRAALSALLGLGIASAAIVAWFDALEASILAAAASAALVYAAVIWTRERAPFVECPRAASARGFGYALALGFAALAIAVVLDARAARSGVLMLLGAAYFTAWLASRRLLPRPAPRWSVDQEVARAD